ncbi:MAG: nuclear transport factor 2 family protein [Sphingosinicella sp.]|nr:nuclear transport factor 2 family protein [Sphingosinicella sp.]
MQNPPASPFYIDPGSEIRNGLADALYRFGAGQDLRDRALFASAFSVEASLDFTQPASRLGAEIPVFEGRDFIVEQIFSTIAPLDTTHSVTNVRVTEWDGEKARIFALVEAQHLPKADHSRHLLLKNFYHCDLTHRDGLWLIDTMLIHNVWWTGDSAVLLG